MIVRLALPLLLLGACTGEPEEEDLPPCTFHGSLQGAVMGTLDISQEDCSGVSYEGFSGGSWSDGSVEISVLLSEALLLTAGTTVDDVPAEVTLSRYEPSAYWYHNTGNVECWADVDRIEEQTWWVGTETYVGGTVSCDGPMIRVGSEETVSLTGEAEFYYRVF